MHRILKKLILPLLALAISATAFAQKQGYDVFVPISKYMSQGDAESLSAWFADNLEITVSGNTSDSSRNQAKQILKSFFSKSAPTSFSIQHTAAKGNMKYALASMACGAEVYTVTIFVSYQDTAYKIQQLKIEKAR